MAEYFRTQRSKHLFELVVRSEDAAPEVRYLYGLGEAAGFFEQVLHRGKVKAAFHPRERRVRTKYFSTFGSANVDSCRVFGPGNVLEALETYQQDIAGSLFTLHQMPRFVSIVEAYQERA